MSTRVYVGNLKYEVSWQDLKDHMRQAGTVLNADVLTNASGRSKGCGFVEFSSASEAEKAIATMNDTELKGRLIFVREDRGHAGTSTSTEVTNRERQPRDQRTTREGAQHMRPNFTVYVGNLSWDVTWQDLKDHMRCLGGFVEHAKVLTDPSGRSRGCGLVTFSSFEDMTIAIDQLNNTELKGRPIFIREDRAVGEASSRGGNRLYVGNLDYAVEEQELRDLFETIGEVTRANVIREEGSMRAKGFAIVEYVAPEDAAQAVANLNNSQLRGRSMFVRYDRDEKKRF